MTDEGRRQNSQLHPTVFLDRDGTLIEDRGDLCMQSKNRLSIDDGSFLLFDT